jgi:hypothetical protein
MRGIPWGGCGWPPGGGPWAQAGPAISSIALNAWIVSFMCFPFGLLVCWFDGVVDRALSAVEVVVSGKSAGDYVFRSNDSSFAAPRYMTHPAN